MSATMQWPTADDIAACLTQSSRLVETARGLVEYAERGDGPAILSVHGTPGAHEHGLLAAEFLRVNGYRVIAPSRPGSSRTPLTSGRTPSQQADLMAALLDELDLDHVDVMGFSGGGPATYALAARHPQRVGQLVEVSAACRRDAFSWADRIQKLLLTGRALGAVRLWLAGRFPERILSMMGITGPATPEQLATQTALVRTMFEPVDWPRLQAGNDNDEAQIADLQLPLGDITCPTLIVHGRADSRLSPHAEYAHAAIDGSQLLWIDGGHAAFLFDPAAQQAVLSWLRHEGLPPSMETAREA